jgi:hypothetical protein
MKVSIICPTSLLSIYKNPFHLCYGDIVLRDPKYLGFFASQRTLGKIVILDSSPNLPRTQVDTEALWKAYKLVGPTSVVLPGIDYNWKGTLKLTQAFVKEYGKGIKAALIGLLEGHDLESLRQCYRGLSELCGVIGLPCSLEKIARRDEIVRDLGISLPTVYLEILGNPLTEIPSKTTVGLCTSFPVRLAVESRLLEECIPVPLPLNFSLPSEKIDLELVNENIRKYQEIVNA